jgi:FkbM family methyltransferase
MYLYIKMFNNCNPRVNGEYQFYMKIKPYIKTIFDVGCRTDTEFNTFQGEVHYFDPMPEFINILSKQSTNNKNAYFNNFGLGEENKQLFYYPRYQSFYDRVNSCQISDDSNKIILEIKKAKDYIIGKNITNIDFLKIDTEGYEHNVLKGFEEYLNIVNIIQFEYGGTFLDNNVKLNDVINYLNEKGFHKFSYLSENGAVLITDFNDHYQYCNIVCVNKNSTYSPY